MRHSHTMRNYAKAFFAFTTLAVVGACADSATVAPEAVQAPAFVAPANFVKVGNAVTFRVNNAEGITKKIGAHVINIPAGAICDLVTSGYGRTEWDKPCTPQRGSVVITATVFQGPQGEPFVDFQPAMRFAPNKEVMLFFRQGRGNSGKSMTVKYCDNLGYCVDESITDPSLRHFRVGKTSIVGRRLKHFSGYAIEYAEDCMGLVIVLDDGTLWCEEDGGVGNERRSGYMVASGEDISDVMKDEAEQKPQVKKDH